MREDCNLSHASRGTFADTSSRSCIAGLEGAWTTDPIKWDHGYFHNLMTYDWELSKSPAGATQWTPTSADAQGTVPDAHDPDKRHAPVMFTTDLALKMDPVYLEISKKFHAEPDYFADTFARAWYKLTHVRSTIERPMPQVFLCGTLS